MKRIEIKMTPRQLAEIRKHIGITPFGLLSQPTMHTKTMKILILDSKEFDRCNNWLKRFIPKELKG